MGGVGVGLWVLVDNILYIRLAGERMRLHPVPLLVAYLGGLAFFGASGIVLGPGILAVTVAVLDVWHHRAADAADARSPAAGATPDGYTVDQRAASVGRTPSPGSASPVSP